MTTKVAFSCVALLELGVAGGVTTAEGQADRGKMATVLIYDKGTLGSCYRREELAHSWLK